MSPTILWLIAGAGFIGIEIFGVPGIGFLFAGIAALIVGGGIEMGLFAADAYVAQFVLFFFISCISAALLWKKLKHTRLSSPSYSNIVGTEAVVAAGGLLGSKEGQVKWSGTLMRARLLNGDPMEVVPEGAHVTVHNIEGNLLLVTVKR